MSLVHEQAQESSGVQHLVTEARKVLTDTAEKMFVAHCQLENYETNNTKGISAKDFLKGFGSDQKEFLAMKRAIKRWLIRFNPDFKERFVALRKTK